MQQASELHSRSVSDLFDTGFVLYRRYFALFAGVVAILTIPETVLNLVLVALTPAANVDFGSIYDSQMARYLSNLAAPSTGSWISTVVTFLFGLAITATLIRVASSCYLGENVSLWGAYRSLSPRTVWRLALATVLKYVVVAIAGSIAVGAVVLLSIVIGQFEYWLALIFAAVASFAALVGAAFLYSHLVLLPQAIVLERTGVISGFKRSWRLVGKSWPRVMALYLILALLLFIIRTAVLGTVGAVLLGGALSGEANRLMNTAVGALVGILLQPVQEAVMVLLYYDLRIRNEAFDLQHEATRIGQVETA